MSQPGLWSNSMHFQVLILTRLMSGMGKESYWQAFNAGDYPRSILSSRLTALRKHCDRCTRNCISQSPILFDTLSWGGGCFGEKSWIAKTTTFKSCVSRRCKTCAISVHHLEILTCYQSWQINAWQLWLEAGLWKIYSRNDGIASFPRNPSAADTMWLQQVCMRNISV